MRCHQKQKYYILYIFTRLLFTAYYRDVISSTTICFTILFACYQFIFDWLSILGSHCYYQPQIKLSNFFGEHLEPPVIILSCLTRKRSMGYESTLYFNLVHSAGKFSRNNVNQQVCYGCSPSEGQHKNNSRQAFRRK